VKIEEFRYFEKEELKTLDKKDSFLAIIDEEILNVNMLFKTLDSKLNFPNYFGYNWNALFDLLRDFHWIKQKHIYLIHTKIPSLKKQEFLEYIDILYETLKDWQRDDNEKLFVYFPKEEKKYLESIL